MGRHLMGDIAGAQADLNMVMDAALAMDSDFLIIRARLRYLLKADDSAEQVQGRHFVLPKKGRCRMCGPLPVHLRPPLTAWLLLQEALSDLNAYLSPEYGDRSNNFFCYQERGVLRKLLGDLIGALEDLNAALQQKSANYECLEHRADVKRLQGDAAGAETDKSRAQEVEGGREQGPAFSFGILPVTELGLL